jgi:exodeoxyribonuclease VII large subunit
VTAQVVPVALLSSYIRELFDSDPLLCDIWVEGEVSEVFISRAGHVYFTLRDAESQIKCVLFKSYAQRQRVIPAVGDHIAAHGRVTTYDRDGVYQLYVDVLQHAGQGLLALQFERLRQKLEADGLFDESRKRPLPPMPIYIGVVTSAEGAVWHDIQTVLRRRYPLAHLILSPAPVQGDRAPSGIVAALDRIQRDGRAEIVIVARGGGSAEDLACFNDERVARAVFACRIPVISAIGHETDWTIIDLVADLRAPTPSAAAELCAPSISTLHEDLRGARDRANAAIKNIVHDYRDNVAGRERILERLRPEAQLRAYRDEIRRLALATGIVKRTILPARRAFFLQSNDALRRKGRSSVFERRADVVRYGAVLDALSPAHVIGRGFAALEAFETGKLITSVEDVTTGQRMIAWIRDGQLSATIDRVDGIPGVRHNAEG